MGWTSSICLPVPSLLEELGSDPGLVSYQLPSGRWGCLLGWSARLSSAQAPALGGVDASHRGHVAGGGGQPRLSCTQGCEASRPLPGGERVPMPPFPWLGAVSFGGLWLLPRPPVMSNPDQGQAVLCPLGRVLHSAAGRVSAFGNRLLPFYVGVTILLPGRWAAGSEEEWVLRNKFGGPSWEQTDCPRRGAPAGRPFCGASGTAASSEGQPPSLGLLHVGCPWPCCWRVGGPSPLEAPLPLRRCGPVVWPGAWARGGSPGGELRGFPGARLRAAGLCGTVGLGDGPLVGGRAAALSVRPGSGPLPPWQLGRGLPVTRLGCPLRSGVRGLRLAFP